MPKSPLLVPILFALCGLFLLPHRGEAQQARLALEIGAGATLPLSPSHHAVPELHTALERNDSGPSFLQHLRNRSGGAARLTVLLSGVEIGYQLSVLGWAGSVPICDAEQDASGVFLDQAHRRPNGVIDDRHVRYRCGRGRVEVLPGQEERELRPLMLHLIHGGRRFYAVRPRRVHLYALAGFGLALTSHHPQHSVRRMRIGLVPMVGGGLELPLDRSITLTVDARYQLYLMGRAGDYSLNAARAVARDRRVFAAVLDPFHALQISAGICFRIR